MCTIVRSSGMSLENLDKIVDNLIVFVYNKQHTLPYNITTYSVRYNILMNSQRCAVVVVV